MTDREKLDAILADIPGDADSWQALAIRFSAILPRMSHPYPWTTDAFGNIGDKTIDAMTWGHVRNMERAIREFAFVLGAAERGDDPDIPF